MPCHSITDLRQFYNYFSSVTYYFIIGVFLATLCFYDILSFHVHVHVHISIRFHVSHQIHEHIIHVLLFLYESNLLRNWNHSNRIIQTQVMASSCQLVGLPILPEGQFEKFIFQCLFSIFDTGSLYSFKYKVLRVLLQLESPNSEH